MRPSLFSALFSAFSRSRSIHRLHDIRPPEEAMFGPPSPLTPSFARRVDGYDSRQALNRRFLSPSPLSRIATVVVQLPIRPPSSPPLRLPLTHAPLHGNAFLFTPNTRAPSLHAATLRESSKRRHQLASVHPTGRAATPAHSRDVVLSLRRTLQLLRTTARPETSHCVPCLHLCPVPTEPAADSLSLSARTSLTALRNPAGVRGDRVRLRQRCADSAEPSGSVVSFRRTIPAVLPRSSLRVLQAGRQTGTRATDSLLSRALLVLETPSLPALLHALLHVASFRGVRLSSSILVCVRGWVY